MLVLLVLELVNSEPRLLQELELEQEDEVRDMLEIDGIIVLLQ